MDKKIDLGEIRAVRDEDLDLMLAWRNSPAVRVNMYTHHKISADEHFAWWDWQREQKDQTYFMYERAGDALGIIYFTKIDDVHRNSYWGFYASPQARKGTGSRMEILALDYAFDCLKLHKLKCEVLSHNKSVVKMHEKFGFKVEGVLRQEHLFEESYLDIIKLGLLESEWRAVRQEMYEKVCRISEAN